MLRQVANRSRLLLDAGSRWNIAAALRTSECYPSAATSKEHEDGNLQQFGNLFQRGFASGGASSSERPAAPGGTGAAPAGSGQSQQADESSAAQKEFASDIELLQAVIHEQNAAAEKHQDTVEEMKDKLLRTLADMENLRDRTARQIDANKQFAIQGFAKNLLDVADSLERAAGAVPAEALAPKSKQSSAEIIKHLQTLLEGVQLTDKQLKSALQSSGVTKYEALGHKFDPNMHSALFEVADPSKEPGTVGVVTKSGYMLNDKVLRAAEVGVVRKST